MHWGASRCGSGSRWDWQAAWQCHCQAYYGRSAVLEAAPAWGCCRGVEVVVVVVVVAVPLGLWWV